MASSPFPRGPPPRGPPPSGPPGGPPRSINSAPPDSGRLFVKALRCEDLKAGQDIFSTANPFAVLRIGTQEHCTKPNTGGGKTPIWNEEFEFDISSEKEIHVEILSKRSLRDSFLGESTVPIKEWIVNGSFDGFLDLNDKKNNFVGKFFVHVRFERTAVVAGRESDNATNDNAQPVLDETIGKVDSIARKAKRTALDEFTKENNLKPESIKKAYKRFQAIDKDKSGVIDYTELCEILQVDPSPIGESVFRLYDYDKTGQVDARELLIALSNFVGAGKEDRLKFAFMSYDKDGNGVITKAELLMILKSNHFALLDAEVARKADTIMAQADKDGDGVITFDQFMHILCPEAKENEDSLAVDEPQLVILGTLSIKALRGLDLKAGQGMFGKADPYASLRIGSQEFKTRPNPGGGKNPIWNEEFDFDISNEKELEIGVFDKEIVGNDKFMGLCKVSIVEWIANGKFAGDLELMDKANKPVGMITLSCRYEPNVAPAEGEESTGTANEKEASLVHDDVDAAALARALEKGGKEWRRSKIMIVGEGRAGKTSFSHSITGKGFDGELKSTVGINQLECTVTYAVRSIAGAWGSYNKGQYEFECALAEMIKNKEEIDATEGLSMLELMKQKSAQTTGGNVGPARKERTTESAAKNAASGGNIPVNAETGDDVAAEKDEALVEVDNENENEIPADNGLTPSPNKNKDGTFVSKENQVNDLALQTCLASNINNSSNLIISVFDYGGQPVYNVIHHLFLTQNGVYVLVFNMEWLACPDHTAEHQKCLRFITFWITASFCTLPIMKVTRLLPLLWWALARTRLWILLFTSTFHCCCLTSSVTVMPGRR